MSHSADPIPSWKRRVRRSLSRAWGVARQNPVPVGLAVVAWLCIVAQSVLGDRPSRQSVLVGLGLMGMGVLYRMVVAPSQAQ